jgi:hypothetical protein
MPEKAVLVGVDDRIRLMSAMLAITDWPERAQHNKGHRPHAHARSTTKWLAGYESHYAVQCTQWLLNQNAPPEALFAFILKCDWPSMEIANPPRWMPQYWNYYLRDIYERAYLQNLWDQDANSWRKAEVEADSLMRVAGFYEFLQPFVGEIQEQMIYMANVSYPSDFAIGVRVGWDLICIGPPRIAWGDNPPWPFDEDPAHVYSSSLSEYARLLMLAYLRQNAEKISPITRKELPVSDEFRQMHPTWGDQFMELFVPGLVALYLEEQVSPQEAKAFILMEKKSRGLTILPGVVSVLQRYLNEYEEGRFSSFADFLPYFPRHLRIAKTISAI